MKNSTIYTLSLLFVLLLVQHSNAQQDPNFTLYNFNMNIINPAYAGSQEFPELNVVYRSQWIGIDDAPRTATFVYSTALGNNLGIGVTAMNDKVFVLDQTDLAVDISYKLKLGEESNLYFGMKVGGGFVNIDLTRATTANDPLFTQNQSFFNPHVGAGMYIENPDFYISVSTPNFLNGDRYEKNGNVPSAAVENMHFYVGGGYHFNLNGDLVLTPRAMIRAVEGAPASYDLGASLMINDKVTTGINYRVNELYSVYGMYTVFERLQFGVAYDITKDQSLVNDEASLEFLVKYRFK